MEALPDVPLSDAKLLLATGTSTAPRLETWFRQQGTDLDTRHIAAGHAPTTQDVTLAREWLDRQRTRG